MNISEKLDQKKFLEILLHAYFKGESSEEINIVEFIEEIKQQVLVSYDETFV
jgi:Mg2+/Co2+ transporter CorC